MRVVVIGGGAVGSAVALYLKRLGGAAVEVTVVEPDPGLARASSALSAGSIRQQFSNAVNVQLSQVGQAVLQALQHGTELPHCDAGSPAQPPQGYPPADLGYVASGYLFLARDTAGAAVLRANHAVQRGQGATVELLQRDALAAQFPWLHTDDVLLASLGRAGEGWFDGYALARALAARAQALGAKWRRDRVVGFEPASARGPGTQNERRPEAAPTSGRLQAAVLGDGTRLAAEAFVNAAGPWAREVARQAGLELPVFARRRTVFQFSCPTAFPRTPLVIAPGGVWFRSEGTGFIGAWTPGEGDPDPDQLPLEPDVAQFEHRLWPALAERVPAFEALRLQRAWAGYYEVHPLDHNAIIGPHPALANLVFANGFSGHGLQHAAGAGRGVAEWLLEGRYRSIDLTPFGWQRVIEGRAFTEQAVI